MQPVYNTFAFMVYWLMLGINQVWTMIHGSECKYLISKETSLFLIKHSGSQRDIDLFAFDIHNMHEQVNIHYVVIDVPHGLIVYRMLILPTCQQQGNGKNPAKSEQSIHTLTQISSVCGSVSENRNILGLKIEKAGNIQQVRQHL